MSYAQNKMAIIKKALQAKMKKGKKK